MTDGVGVQATVSGFVAEFRLCEQDSSRRDVNDYMGLITQKAAFAAARPSLVYVNGRCDFPKIFMGSLHKSLRSPRKASVTLLQAYKDLLSCHF